MDRTDEAPGPARRLVGLTVALWGCGVVLVGALIYGFFLMVAYSPRWAASGVRWGADDDAGGVSDQLGLPVAGDRGRGRVDGPERHGRAVGGDGARGGHGGCWWGVVLAEESGREVRRLVRPVNVGWGTMGV